MHIINELVQIILDQKSKLSLPVVEERQNVSLIDAFEE